MPDDSSRPRRAFSSDDSELHSSETANGGFKRPAKEVPPPINTGGSRPKRMMLPADITEDDPRFVGYDDETIVVQRSGKKDPMIPAPVLPNSPAPHGAGPKPRRSALSSSSPQVFSDDDHQDTKANSSQQDSAGQPTPIKFLGKAMPAWFSAHVKGFAAAGIAVVVLGVGAGVGGYFSAHSTSPGSSPEPSPVAPSDLPRVTVEDLITEADAKAISANATWAITQTSAQLDEHTARPACLATNPSDIQLLDSLQRTIGTTEENRLALLHQLDSFPSVEAASQAYATRAAALASCNEVPTLILNSSSVQGLGDEATQITVVDEGESRRYHSVLLSRMGNVLTIVDVASADSAAEATLSVEALRRSVTKICAATGCSIDDVKVESQPVPASDPAGWLIPSDLPRIRPGFGRWTAKNPGVLDSPGTGCENLTLASEAGPTERLQAFYNITQDDQRPERFGMDEMVFTFADAAQASAFANKLGANVASCGDRVLGTTVNAVSVPEGAQAFEMTRKIDSGDVLFQVAVTAEATKVSYLLATVTTDYKFTPEQLAEVSTRARVRLKQ